jgi:hypothetical protein
MAELDGPRARSLRLKILGRDIDDEHGLRARPVPRASGWPTSWTSSIARERLSLDDGVRLFRVPRSPRGSARWRTASASAAHGADTFYNFNLRLEATERLRGQLSSSARLHACGPGDPDSYTMSLEQVFDKLRARAISRSPKSTSSTACTRPAVLVLHGPAARLKAIRPKCS